MGVGNPGNRREDRVYAHQHRLARGGAGFANALCDLGMIADGDVVLALSESGETEEMSGFCRQSRVPMRIITMCGDQINSGAKRACLS